MKRLAAVVSVAACAGLAQGFAWAGELSFTLYNQTGVELDELYVQPHEADESEDDLLGDATLPHNENLRIRFVPEEDVDDWDIRAISAQGAAILWEEVELKDQAGVTLYLDNGKAWAEVE